MPRYLLRDAPWVPAYSQQSFQAQLGIRMTSQDWTPQALDTYCSLSRMPLPREPCGLLSSGRSYPNVLFQRGLSDHPPLTLPSSLGDSSLYHRLEF